MTVRRVAVLLVGLVFLAGCGGGAAVEQPGDSGLPTAEVTFDPALSRELQAMARADQRGSGLAEDRQARLADILDQHGWPGHDLVGEEGSTAAWVIAQHADLDPALQERALGLLREAVAQGQASPGDLAYLTDRVAVAAGEPQPYGTQVRCVQGRPLMATPIEDRATLDERRVEAGLEPLRDYLSEMEGICSRG